MKYVWAVALGVCVGLALAVVFEMHEWQGEE